VDIKIVDVRLFSRGLERGELLTNASLDGEIRIKKISGSTVVKSLVSMVCGRVDRA
jgi:hypothetical protein